jgi:hypothetical protein
MDKQITDNFLFENLVIQLNNKQLRMNIYDTPLGLRWIEALKDNLKQKKILEKNFCFLGFADSKRNLEYLCNEVNQNIAQINSFNFNPEYPKLKSFAPIDFQHSSTLPTGLCANGNEWEKPGLRLKHDACNLLHRYFEELQGTAWKISDYYKQADIKTKYAIRQLNNLCHEIESWVASYRKSVVDPAWMRPSQITTFLNAPRHDLHEEDYELFKQNRYNRELGGVYLHWSQIGKTLYEVFRDEHAPVMTETMCSEINHQKYYSGEFDIEWGDTITEDTHPFKKKEMEEFRKWLKENNYDWEDPKLALGYIKIGQIDMKLAFQNKPFTEVYNIMKNNLNIKSIHTIGSKSWENEYPYTLESDDWKQIQIEGLKKGYESRSMR